MKPARRRARRLLKPLIGALLMLAGILAPIRAPDFSAPDLAHAQTPPPPPAPTLVTGTPDPCPADPTDTRPWMPDTNDESLCVLQESACTEVAEIAGHVFVPSADFPDFCETIVPGGDPLNADCQTLTGVVVEIDGATQDCRVIKGTGCSGVLHRVDFNVCRLVVRRGWSCPQTPVPTSPTNRFNQCFPVALTYTGTNPACAQGAPTFVITDCTEYVGADFIRNPVLGECSNAFYDTGDTSREMTDNVANLYWCRFDASWLELQCHTTGASCTRDEQLCVKRASDAGGCSEIAKTIRCRAEQATYLAKKTDYDSGVISDDDLQQAISVVYRENCKPCLVQPFTPAPVTCPAYLSAEQQSIEDYDRAPGFHAHFDATHREKADFRSGHYYCTNVRLNGDSLTAPQSANCRRQSVCADPPTGLLNWQSTHASGFALVNSEITVTIGDLPRAVSQASFGMQRIILNISPPDVRFRIWRPSRSLVYYEFPSLGSGSNRVRTWLEPSTTTTYDTVNELVSDLRRGGGECSIAHPPQFRLRVEELLPLTDGPAIRALFGPNALDDWDRLDAATQQRLADARPSAISEEIECNYGDEVWCRWRPPRAGFYRLQAAGAWFMRRYTPRVWRDAVPFDPYGQVNAYLLALDPADGDCADPEWKNVDWPRWPNATPQPTDEGSMNDRDCILRELSNLGLTPAESGFETDANGNITGLLPIEPDEWLYSSLAPDSVACPPTDLRIECGSGNPAMNYTETAPVGIRVHEMRVRTVSPS